MHGGGSRCSTHEHGREQAEGATQSNNYWSSSTYQDNPNNAWFVYFNFGDTGALNKTLGSFVRAVRAGS